MKENILKGKSYQFVLSIIKLCQNLTSGKREFVLSKQILKSGTSIGANVEDLALTINAQPAPAETLRFSAEMIEGTITDLYIKK